jgi:acetyl esterase/lipase
MPVRLVPQRSVVVLLLSLSVQLSAQARHIAVDSGVPYLQREGRSATFDVIRPLTGANGAGVIFFTTGCWVSRSVPPSIVVDRLGPLLAAGFTLFVVRHLNDSLGTVPAIVADLDRAVRRIMTVAPTYQVDPTRLGLLGTSAAGHVALTLGLMPYSLGALHARAIVAFFAPTDLRLLPKRTCRTLDFPEDQAARISPITLASATSPPTLLLTGDRDSTIPMGHSENLVAALRQLGVPTDLVIFPGMGHGLLFGALPPHESDGVTRTVAWFRRYLMP